MKVLSLMSAIPLLAALALAQQQTKEPAAGKAAETQAQAGAPAPTSGEKPSEMKTEGYSGTLVDASCASGSSASRAQETAAANPAEPGKEKPGANSAEPSPGGDQSQCGVSPNTSKFALKMSDGRTVKFDEVGNQRAQEALKNKKKWSEAAGSGKPIHAKTTGVLTGDQLVVLSIR